MHRLAIFLILICSGSMLSALFMACQWLSFYGPAWMKSVEYKNQLGLGPIATLVICVFFIAVTTIWLVISFSDEATNRR